MTEFKRYNRLINVFGKACRGKTSTLDCLIKKLISNPDFTLLSPDSGKDINDRIIGRLNNQVIGIITLGDPGQEEEIESFLDECLTNKCDVIYAASRTYGGVYNTEKRFASANGYLFIETSPLYLNLDNGKEINYSYFHELFSEMLYNLI